MEAVADELVDKVVARMQKLKVGSPHDNADITPVVTESSANFIEGLVLDAKEKGAKLCQVHPREGLTVLLCTVCSNGSGASGCWCLPAYESWWEQALLSARRRPCRRYCRWSNFPTSRSSQCGEQMRHPLQTAGFNACMSTWFNFMVQLCIWFPFPRALASLLVLPQEYKREGNLIWPLLVDHVRPDMRVAWEEPFGPVVPVIRITTVEEGVHHCNANNFGLQVRTGSP